MTSGSVDVQDDVPAPPLDAVDDAIERGHIGRAAETFHEIEAHAAHTAAVERVEILVGETFVDNGDTTIAPGIGGDAIEHRSIISAVTTRLHDYRTFNAKVRVQGRQHFLRRISRRIAPVCCIGKFRGRAKDVAMGITAACWRLEARLATMVEKSCVDVHGLALAKRSRRHNPHFARKSPRAHCAVV